MLSTLTNALDEKKDAILTTQLAVLKADCGNMYALDLLFIGAANRSLALIDGFKALHKAQNFLCMAPIVRMHLDTALRLHATTLVKQPDDLATDIIKGVKISRIKDSTNNKMTDAYLRKQFVDFWAAHNFDMGWVDKVYDKTSAHIHLSSAHIFASVDNHCEQDATVTFGINGAVPHHDRLAEEACHAMCEISDIVAHYIGEWSKQKGSGSV